MTWWTDVALPLWIFFCSVQSKSDKISGKPVRYAMPITNINSNINDKVNERNSYISTAKNVTKAKSLCKHKTPPHFMTA